MKTVPNAALASNAFFTRTSPSLACRNSTMKQCYFTVMAQAGRSSLFVSFVSFPQHGDLEVFRAPNPQPDRRIDLFFFAASPEFVARGYALRAAKTEGARGG